MAPQKVYRIEGPDGDGPYRPLGYVAIHGRNLDEDRHPVPHRDGLGWPDPWEFFGFSSRKQLNRWFNKKARKTLAEKGFRLVVYESEHVRPGGHQVVFNKGAAEPVETLALP